MDTDKAVDVVEDATSSLSTSTKLIVAGATLVITGAASYVTYRIWKQKQSAETAHVPEHFVPADK